MFSQHVGHELSAYCQGELGGEDSRRVAEHLINCQLCRRELEEIRLGISIASKLLRAQAPARMWSEIEAALDKQQQQSRASASTSASLAKPRARRFSFDWRLVAAACAVLVLAFGAAWFFTRRMQDASELVVKDKTAERKPTNPVSATGWDVARLAGAPKVGVELIEKSGRLAVGEWLETDASSRARINVANIGQVEVEPNSRVRLVGTNPTEHRLAMSRGRMSASINAPPRLFIVDTPSAVAVDLGCAYTLEVDEEGRGRLHVTDGWVALEAKGRESLVPAGAICETQPDRAPGTPYFDDVSPKFRDALAKLDAQGRDAKALSIILTEAREYDTLTLWHLLSRVEGADRLRVYERMAALIAPPAGVTREGIMQLDEAMLEHWKKELEWAWFE